MTEAKTYLSDSERQEVLKHLDQLEKEVIARAY